MIDIASCLTVRSVWNSRVQEHPEREFLVFLDNRDGEELRYTYGQFDAQVNQVANMLSGLGIESGDKVAAQLGNSVEFIECFLAVMKLGGVFIPLDCEDTEAEKLYVTSLCDVKLLVENEKFAVGGNCQCHCNRLLVTKEESADSPTYHQLKKLQSTKFSLEPTSTDEDLAEVLFTSGTTSKPKGVMLTQANLVFSGFYVNWELQMDQNDRYFTTMATNRVNFQLSAMMPILTVGGTLILSKKYSASRFWNQVISTKATLVQAMAMIAKTMLRQPVAPNEKQHNVRSVHYFLPITVEEKNQFEQRFAVPLVNNYGTSETLVGSVTDVPQCKAPWPSIGRPGLGYQAKVVTDTGSDAPAGKPGEIWVKGEQGRTLMAGYWKDPQATAAALDAQGWYHTGDWGYVDEHGWMYFLDRQVDLIKRTGENISAAEVEAVIAQCPAVEEVAVVAVTDPIRDEAVKAVVVPKEGMDLDEETILEFCAPRLAKYKIPSVVEFREQLPRGAYGKVLKNLLKGTDNGN